MSVLHGANNTTINNGVFNVISNAFANNVLPPNDIVSVLLRHSATAGLLDAAERFDAPKCDEGTRTSMLLEMKRFVQQGGSPSIFWLHGPAGVGKSALAQTLALSLKEEGDHAASFFFSRTAPGRNNGNQLIVTLACQLALSIPPLKPLIAKAVNQNPLIFNATNIIKIQTLIVDPLNQLHKKSRWNPRMWAQRVAQRELHPRLILVDGLDECDDPLVQRDLILCVGHAVRQLSLPFRFIITSRPGSHILATFDLDPIFQDPHGVKVVTKNLGDDEDADEQITTFLLKEFVEIRRTHPIREFLPQTWPLPGQIAQLVSKSSKGFIYPATVIRYIKMLNNRPDECLERILGLLEIPVHDKPYEALDALYYYIFESVPDANKKAVRNIFHFLTIPNNFQLDGFIITPRLIERYYHYKPGHVQHVLRDLLCVVGVTAIDHPIKVLHASLPDFLLDPSRSGTLCVNAADAHTTIIVSLLEASAPVFISRSTCTQIIYHLLHSNLTERLLNVLIGLNPIYEYGSICEHMLDSRSIGPKATMFPIPEALLESTTLVVAYLGSCYQVPTKYINNHIEGVEKYILRNYPLGVFLHAVGDDVMHEIFSSLRKCARTTNSYILELFEASYGAQHSSQLVLRVSRLHMLMMTPYFALPAKRRTVSDRVVPLADPLVTYPRLAQTLLVFLKNASTDTGIFCSFVVDLISTCMARSGYSKPLLNLLELLIATRPPSFESDLDLMSEYYPKLMPTIGQYLERVKLQAPETTL